MKKVIVIVGPTASGKTKLSVELAKRVQAEIINGDSVQIYKRLNIGSAKIKPEETNGIKHHLFDIVDPKHTYSVYNFQRDVRNLINQIDIPMIVGGTGLYIKAALYDYEFDKENHHQYQTLEHLSNEALYDQLMLLDPEIKIDAQNRRRLIRALTLAKQGVLRSKKNKKDELLYDACVIYLDLDRKVLEERLHFRLEQQLKDGFIEEVEDLLNDHISVNAIGYREIEQYLKQEISFDEMKELIIRKSKQLAKKQKTWFKNQMQTHIIDALDQHVIDHAYDIVKEFLNQKEHL